MIQTQSDAIDTTTIVIFVMLKSIDIAELLFQKHCPGYAMSVTTSTNILCISHSFFCKHLSKSQVLWERQDAGWNSSDLFWWRWNADQVQIYFHPEIFERSHIYKNGSNIKYWQPLLYVACYVSDYKLRLNESEFPPLVTLWVYSEQNTDWFSRICNPLVILPLHF